MKKMNGYKVTKGMIITDIICSFLWMLNVVIRLLKHPDDTFGIVIWSIGALLFAMAAYSKYKVYKEQSFNLQDKEM